MRIRKYGVMGGALVAFVAATSAASCGGQSVDRVSQDAGAEDAQTDGSVSDSASVDASTADADANSCPPHQVTCNDVCTDTRFDPSACGSCTNHCGPFEVCANGVCASTCPSTEAACRDEDGGLRCADALNDNANCGYCGNVCAPGTICSNGKCRVTCDVGQTKCTAGDGSEFCSDLQNDPDDCNACGNVCPHRSNVALSFCSAGTCGITCNSNALDCNGMPADGCEVLPATDAHNCGGCGVVCPASASCANSKCSCPDVTYETVEACNGACTNIERDPNNCGACGARCVSGSPFQSADCVESACHTSNRAVTASTEVTSIAIDDTYVYFTERGIGIERVTKGSTGETPVRLIDDSTVSTMAIHGGTIFWTDFSGIFECPATGCVGSPNEVSDTSFSGSRVVVDDTSFYWTTASGANACPQTGCGDAPITLTNEPVAAIAPGPSLVFIITHVSPFADNLYSIVPNDPPAPAVVFATHTYPNAVAYHGGQVYFFTGGNLVSCDPTACTPKVLVPQHINPNTLFYYTGPIAADDTSVLWAADGIHEVNLATGVDSVIANIPSDASQLAIDTTNVYWAASDGIYWAPR